jgi:transcription-repair coupling factor (superfamily II helicase)
MLSAIRDLPAYQALLEDLQKERTLTGLELPRSARLPVAVALSQDLKRPILFLTERLDQALKILDELGFWDKGIHKEYFAEPNPLFYEQAAWGTNTRRDRLEALASLASFYTPGLPAPEKPPFVVATVRSVMARTLPRREFIKACRLLRLNQEISPDVLKRHWVDIGYESADVVVEPAFFLPAAASSISGRLPWIRRCALNFLATKSIPSAPLTRPPSAPCKNWKKYW